MGKAGQVACKMAHGAPNFRQDASTAALLKKGMEAIPGIIHRFNGKPALLYGARRANMRRALLDVFFRQFTPPDADLVPVSPLARGSHAKYTRRAWLEAC